MTAATCKTGPFMNSELVTVSHQETKTLQDSAQRKRLSASGQQSTLSAGGNESFQRSLDELDFSKKADFCANCRFAKWQRWL